MTRNALISALLAVGVAALTTLVAAALIGTALGLPLHALVSSFMLAAFPGLVALGGAAFYRIQSAARLPHWSLIFIAAGLLSVAVWVVAGIFPRVPPAEAVTGVKEYVEVTEFFPYVMLAITPLWAMCGLVVSWLDARLTTSEKRS